MAGQVVFMALQNRMALLDGATTQFGHIRGSMAGTWCLYASNSDPKVACSNFSSLRIRTALPIRKSVMAKHRTHQRLTAKPVASSIPNIPR
jgi:hypothetical protein